MKRVSITEYMNMKNIHTREVFMRSLEKGEIPNVYKDAVTGAISILVEDENGSEITPELQKELDFIQNPNRMTLADYAKYLDMPYPILYSSLYTKGRIPNTFHDKVTNKITVIIDKKHMAKLKKDMEGTGYVSLGKAAVLLGLNDNQLRYMATKGKIATKRFKEEKGYLYIGKNELIKYIDGHVTLVQSVKKACAEKSALSIKEVSQILGKTEAFIRRWVSDGVLKSENGRVKSESLSDVFFNSGVFNHEIFVSSIKKREIEKLFEQYDERSSGVKLSQQEIAKLPRVTLADYANQKKGSKRSYFSLLNDFYAGKLNNAGRDEVTKSIFVILYNKTIDPQAIHDTFNQPVKRVGLMQWARSQNILYNKAKVQLSKQQVPGVLYDPVCNSYSIEIEGDHKSFTPYIRLDQEKYDTNKPYFSAHDFCHTYDISSTYFTEAVESGKLKASKKGGKKVYMKADVDAFFKERKKKLEAIVKFLKEKDHYTLKEMSFLTDRPAKFVNFIAIKRKWLPHKEFGEFYTREDYLNFVEKHDKYWSSDERKFILKSLPKR